MLSRRKASVHPHRSSVKAPKKFRLVLTLILVAVTMVFVGPTSPASAAGEPTVTRVSPTSGPLKGGQTVVVTGTGFTGTTGVKFGATAVTSFAVVDDKSLVVVVPDTTTAGKALIEVTNANGANTAGSSYEYKAPTISKISPGWANNDASSFVTVTGTGLLGTVKGDIKFGTADALNVWVVSDTTIVIETPIDGGGITVDNGVTDVIITRNTVASVADDDSKFLFSPGVPTISQLGDTAVVKGTDDAAAGSLLTIKGTQLWGVSQVNFGTTKVTTAADIVVAADGLSMTVKVPTRSNGPVDVVVDNASGSNATNLNTRFEYYSTAAPKITKVDPGVVDKTDVTGGGTVLITGTGLTGIGTAEVKVKCASDLTPTSVTSVTDTSAVLILPDNDGTAATCDLEITNPIDNTKVGTLTGAIRYV